MHLKIRYMLLKVPDTTPGYCCNQSTKQKIERRVKEGGEEEREKEREREREERWVEGAASRSTCMVTLINHYC